MTIVPLEVRAGDGDVFIRAKDPDYANPGPEEVHQFLETIGFFRPDPPPPSEPDRAFCSSHAVLLLTSRCNLRCTYCYADGGEGPVHDLALEVARTAVDHAHQNAQDGGLRNFQLTFHGGGEPIQAWKTLRAATAYARGKDLPCRVAMVSNGVWSARQREWILANFDELSISLDGAKETQDRQRPFASGRGSFSSVMRTIEALDRAEFPYGIRMTATAPWRGRLVEDVRFVCEATGCPAIQVEPAFNTRRGTHRGPTPEEGEAFVEAFMEAFEAASQLGRRLTYSGARPWLLTQTFCSAPYSALVVNPSGDLVACYEAADRGHPLGDLSRMGCVADSGVVVDKEARCALFDYLEDNRAKCRDCFCYWHCGGDCASKCFSSHEENRGRCRVNRAITRDLLAWYIAAANGVWPTSLPRDSAG